MKRSVAGADAELPAAKKKRAVLGEITNLSETISSADPIKPGKPKPAAKTKKVKKVVSKSDSVEKPHVHTTSDDPQMCGPYVSDIYEYLHKMEVIRFLFFIFLMLLFSHFRFGKILKMIFLFLCF